MPLTRHELFAVDPGDFVARRDELARTLRAEGDEEHAAEIKKLRRPSVPVWALNAVADRSPELVEQLVATAADARDAQRALLEQSAGDDFRATLSRRRAAMAEFVAAAAAVVAESGRSSDSYARDLEDQLNAVVTAPELCAALRRGELVDGALGAADATDVFAGITLPDTTRIPARPESRARPKVRPEPQPEPQPELEPPGPSAELTRARAELEQRRDALTAAERELDAAQTAAAESEQRLEQAQAEAERTAAASATAKRQRDLVRQELEESRLLVEQLEA